jgi:sialate O-acetylesterase
MVHRIGLLLCFAVVMPETAAAEFKLSPGIGDHMVVQRDIPIRITGTDEPGRDVRLRLGDDSVTCRAGADGRWVAELPARKAGGPHSIMVSGSQTRTIDDVLVGEVWFCSGQSNMAWVVTNSKNAGKEIPAANYPKLRLMTVLDKPKENPPYGHEVPWAACTPKTVGYWSGVAYFFGRELHKELDVPVGLIVSAVNGTRIEPWTPAVGVAAVPELDKDDRVNDGDLYKRLVHPYTTIPIRGVIWYQGEGNVGDLELLYHYRMKALIGGWRTNWKQGDFPFYYAQLTPLNWGGKPVDMHPHVWQSQLETLKVPNTGMIVTTDIVGHTSEAHPRNKLPFGQRLANLALAKTYGRSGIVFSGPLYRSFRREGANIRVEFDHTDGGLSSRDGKALSWFTIAGEDGKFIPAKAVVDGNTVVVSAETVPEPRHARLGWHQIAEPNLINGHGLPASPFRTDRGVPKGVAAPK